jgi:hypothetical protein
MPMQGASHIKCMSVCMGQCLTMSINMYPDVILPLEYTLRTFAGEIWGGIAHYKIIDQNNCFLINFSSGIS